MGSIIYGHDAHAIRIDDEVLCYIKTVVLLKLRRNESFTISYDRAGQGRASIWVHPATCLQFSFDQPASAPLDRDRLARLMRDVNATGDLKTRDAVEV